MREGLAYNYDVLQALARKEPTHAALVDMSWTSQRLTSHDDEPAEPIDPWGEGYPHLAVLWLAERKTKAWAARWDDLGPTEARERWLRVLRFADKIAPVEARRRAKAKVVYILRTRFRISGGFYRLGVRPRMGHSRRAQGKRFVTLFRQFYPSH